MGLYTNKTSIFSGGFTASAATRIPFGGTGGVLTDSGDLTWNDSTKKMEVGGASAEVTVNAASGEPKLEMQTAGTERGSIRANAAFGLFVGAAGSGSLFLDTSNGDLILRPNEQERLRLTTTTGTFADGFNLAVGSTSGTKIGTATTQKLGFFNATPVAQRTVVADPSGGATQDAEARTAIIAVITRLEELGLFASA